MLRRLSITGLVGAAFAVSMLATQPASADKAGEMAALAESCSNVESQPQARLDACTRMIESRYFTDKRLTLAFHFRSVSHFQLGQHQRAIEDAGRAIGRDPKFAGAFYMRGAFYAH